MQIKSRKCTFDLKINAKKDINAKKAENTFSISKFIQKNIKKGKKESTFIWIFFAFISPVHFFAFQT